MSGISHSVRNQPLRRALNVRQQLQHSGFMSGVRPARGTNNHVSLTGFCGVDLWGMFICLFTSTRQHVGTEQHEGH
jgi:hypothetical protein